MFLSIPNIALYSFLQKKSYSYSEGRIFSSSRANNFWNCVFAYPQYWKIFICAKKKTWKTNRQTTFHTRLSLRNGYIIKKKEIQSGGMQLKVK